MSLKTIASRAAGVAICFARSPKNGAMKHIYFKVVQTKLVAML